MKSVIETIQKRRSVRNYSSRAIEVEQLRQISDYINANNQAPLGSDVRFQIVDGSAYNKDELKELGVYGMIKGAHMFIAGAVNRNNYAMEDYGYCMEKNVLMLTSIGLGTCWLGGTLNRSTFAQIMQISDNEIIPAVTPMGYAHDKKSFKGHAASLLMQSAKRKGSKEIFFNSGINNPLNLNECGKFASVLDCVRLAPSAGNMQPWRIIKEKDVFHFYMKENAEYNNGTHYKRFIPGKGEKLQNIDMGIAMAHFDLAAAELGLNGKWRVSEPVLDKGDLKYIVTWVKNVLIFYD